MGSSEPLQWLACISGSGDPFTPITQGHSLTMNLMAFAFVKFCSRCYTGHAGEPFEKTLS